MHTNIHSKTIYNSQATEASKVFTYKWTYKENLVYVWTHTHTHTTHTGVPLSLKKKKRIKLCLLQQDGCTLKVLI